MLLWREKFLEELRYGFIEGFDQTISCRFIECWGNIVDPKLVAEMHEGLTCKLGPIVMNNPSGYTEVVNPMLLDKVNYIWHFGFSHQNGFNLFEEVISCY